MNRSSFHGVILLLTLLAWPANSLRSQTIPTNTLTFLAGVALPTGDFSALDGDNAGYASLGFHAGAEFTSRIIGGFEVGLTGGLAVNSVDEDFFKRLVAEVPVAVKTGSWFDFQFLANTGYFLDAGSLFTFYGRGYGGLVIGTSPTVSYNIAGGYTTSVREESGTGAAFGYGIGGGMMIGRNLDVGVRYLIAQPEYTVTITDGNTSISNKFKQRMDIVEFSVGYQVF